MNLTMFTGTLRITGIVLVLSSSAIAASLNDGPHVFWRDDTTAVVLYYCNDSVITQTLCAIDTIRFDGGCADLGQRYSIPVSAPIADTQTVFSEVTRVFAVSDIHGEIQPLIDLLRAGGVIDSLQTWVWGDGHLVIVGDVFDRGPNVTECLWLIYRLEQEASLNGGAVHYLIGNHEQMVLKGDLRYVNEGYTEGINKATRITYDDMFGPNSELGRWLRTKPTAIIINGTLFVHGGISTEVIGRRISLVDINAQIRRSLDLNSSQLVFDSAATFLVGSLGPLWYRGYHYGIDGKYESATIEQIDSVLAYYGAERIVVGHSEVEGGIKVLHGGKVIAVDVELETLGAFEGLLIERDHLYRCSGTGERTPLIPSE